MSTEHTAEELQDVLIRNGFVRCDIAACNCGSWHARYGLRERFEELKEMLDEAGHPLCNENGNLVRNALQSLIEERDRLRATPAPGAPGKEAAFPPRILALLHEVADRNGTATHGPFEDGKGDPLQDDADAALAWIASREAAAVQALDAARYRLLRRGQHWSVVDGIGSTLRAEALDAAIDAALPPSGAGEKTS